MALASSAQKQAAAQPRDRSDRTRGRQPVSLLRPVRRPLLAVVGLSLIINGLVFTTPIFMIATYTIVLSSRSMTTLVWLLVAAAVALALYGALLAVRAWTLTRIGRAFDDHVAHKVFAAIFQVGQASDVPGRTQQLADLDTVRSFLTGTAVPSLMDLAFAPLMLVALFIVHPVLGIVGVGLAALALVLGVLNHVTTRWLRKAAEAENQKAGRVFHGAIGGAEAAQAMAMVSALRARFSRPRDKARNLYARAADRASLFQAALRTLNQSVRVIMICVGAILVFAGSATPAVLIAGMILGARAIAPMSGAVDNWMRVQSFLTARDRLVDLIEQALAKPTRLPLPAPRGQVTLEGLTVAPPGTRVPVVRNVNVALQPGEHFVVLGASGEGKTTLLRALAGVVAPMGGNVRLDGGALADWPADQLGDAIGYLPQTVELMTGTVAENIARMRQPDPIKVVRAAKLSGLHQTIMKLPQAYDTPLTPGGGNLSGGQRQLLGMTRALYGNVRIAIMDEPTASLDTMGLASFMRCVRKLREAGVTLIVATHAPSLADVADRVMTVSRGVVINERAHPVIGG